MSINALHFNTAWAALDRGPRAPFVYFAVAHEPDSHLESLIKIGTTVDPDRRIAELRKGLSKEPDWLADFSPYDGIQYLGIVFGDEEVERSLHKAFAQHAAGGEWFWFEPIAAWVDQILDAFCVCTDCFVADARSEALALNTDFRNRYLGAIERAARDRGLWVTA